MYILFEESGQFKTATVLSEASATLQVKTGSGKHSKIKRTNVIFSFDDTSPDTLIEEAQKLAQAIDVPFLWESSPTDVFNAKHLAKEYYGDKATTLEHTAMLLCLHDNPIQFHRKGKGLYQVAPEETIKAALLAQEKKRRQAQQQDEWAQALIRGEVPQELRDILPTYLSQPDKNTLAWKAFQQALEATHQQTAEFLLKLGIFPHALAAHRAKFLGQYFPKGTAHTAIEIPHIDALPRAEVQAYSVDDIDTTEIDDAFSIQKIHDEEYIFGIHIACPALVVERNSPLDKIARQRMSTVYCPGDKIPMQSEELIQAFSLNEGQYAPALSLYVRANIVTGEIIDQETKLEEVFIQENLRTNHIEALFTAEALESAESPIPHANLFKPMWAFSKHLRKARDEVRGKPEMLDRIEYNFKLQGPPDDPHSTPILVPRLRNAPLDLIVSEFMILCNSTWAKLLDELGLPGIFRTQQNGRVRMSTHARTHEAIGVHHYAWTTSPLRRYVDLFNQRQLMAAVKHGISARLVAPYKPGDADIFSIINQFESCYAGYIDYQNKMECYWSLRYLEQNRITRTTASVLRDEWVRFDNVPIITTVPELSGLIRGTQIEIDILSIDLYRLRAECRFIQLLET